MLSHLRNARAALSATVCALVLAGCGESTGVGDVQDPDVTDAAIVGEEEAGMAIEAMQGINFALMPQTAEYSGVNSGAAALLVPRPLCATVTGTGDSDGDGIRDNVTYTYALPDCRFTSIRGGTLELTGAIALTDPDPAPSFAFQLTYHAFRWKLTGPSTDDSFTATRNGSRTLTANAAGLSLSNTVSIVRTFPIRADATVSHNTLLTFAPAPGSSLVLGQPLPAGTFSKSGQVTFSRAGRSLTFTLQTVSPLAFDPACEVAPRITSGEIRYVLSNGGYVKLTWTGCGLPAAKEFVPAA